MSLSWQSFYSSPGNAFGIKGPLYGVAGHRGADYAAKAGASTPAYEAGTVALVQYSSVLGTCIVIKTADGGYDGYAHQRASLVNPGEPVDVGQTIGITAGLDDRHGTAWTGPHLHATRGPTVRSIFAGTVSDPRPRIKAAISSSTAGTGGAPLTNRKRSKMNLVWDTGGTGYLLTEDGVLPLVSPQIYNLFYRVINSDQVKSPFVNALRPDVFNGLELAIMASNLRILTAGANAQVAIDPVKLASALKDALGTEFSVDADIDPAELAAAFAEATPRIVKAVNDDAAARLAK